MALFVGKIPPSVSTSELKELFVTHGNLIRVDHRGNHAFLTYENMEDAEKALGALKNKEFQGSSLNVEWTRESGRFQENAPRADGTVPRIRIVQQKNMVKIVLNVVLLII